MKPTPIVILIVTLSFALSSCNLGVPAPQDGNALSTAAALTVEAALSPAASPSAAQATPEASRVPGVAIDGTTAEPAACEENTKIVKWERDGKTYDKTEVDKRLQPNQGFVMSWVIENTGTCTWTDGYKIVFDSGERLTPGDSFPAIAQGLTVPPGGAMSLTIPMAAPATPGDYETTFRIDNAAGERVMFMGVLTNVGTPSNGNLPAPGDLRYAYDCTSGVVSIALTWVDKADGETGYRIYRDGVKLTDLPADATTYSDTVPATGSYLYTVAAFDPEGESPTNVRAETTNCN